MNEFKNIRFCPFCNKFEPKEEWLCIFCLNTTIPYENWRYKSDKDKEKWMKKQKPAGTPRTPKERMELPDDTYNNLVAHEDRVNNFDSRYRAYLADMAAPHTPKCPVCGSPDLQKISTTSKVLDVAFWGFASGKARKVYHCNNCDYEF